jgi:PKD repeat protein
MAVGLSLLMTSCQKEMPAPVVSFEMTISKGGIPLEVTFINTSTGDQAEYLWDFGDGTSSTDENPVHTFTSTIGKDFAVNLTVKGAGGEATATKTVTTVVKKISKVFANNVLVCLFEYDSKGILQNRVFYNNDGSLYQKWQFTYSGNQITEDDFDSSGAKFWKGIWTLGSNGQASSVTGYNYNKDGSTTTDKFEFKYDTNGYMVRRDEYPNNTLNATYTYTIKDGNCVSVDKLEKDGSTSGVVKLEYDTKISRGCPDYITNQFYPFQGKADRNLRKKYTSLTTNTVYTYDYTMDNDGYATKRTVTTTKPDNTTTYTYWNYEYKTF